MKVRYREGVGKHHKADGTVLQPGDVVELSDEQFKAFQDKFDVVVVDPTTPSKSVTTTPPKPEQKSQ